MRDYRTHLQTVLKRSPATINNALAAVDDFYIRRGLGSAAAARLDIPATAPRALDQRAQLRYMESGKNHGRLCGDVLVVGRVGEAGVPAVEFLGEVVVEDAGADLKQ